MNTCTFFALIGRIMELKTMKLHTDHRLPGPFASPWLIIGGALIMGVIILAMTLRNLDREGEQMSTILEEKGAALIKALEAGARTGIRNRLGSEMRMQVLVEEMADQPDILFIMVTDHTGRVLAHSEPDKQGALVFSPEDMSQLHAEQRVNWRIMTKEDTRAFVVYRQFMPLQGREGWWNRIHRKAGEDSAASGAVDGHDSARPDTAKPEGAQRAPASSEQSEDSGVGTGAQDRRGHMGRGRMNGMGGMGYWNGMGNGEMGQSGEMGQMMHDRGLMNFFSSPGGPPPIIYIGMDVTPFEQARANDSRHTLVMAGILLLLGLAGFTSLIWAQNVRRSRRMLHDSQAFSAEIITSLPEGLVLVDADGMVALINEKAEEQLGVRFEDVRGKAPSDVLPFAVTDALGILSRDGRMQATETECQIAGGECIPMSISGARVVAEDAEITAGGTGHVADILILRDLREVRRLQQEVRRKEKLAAVGSLAAGVAHEIRNPLSSIKGYATYFGTRFPEGSEDRDAARIMVEEVDRLNRVITDLIGFSRPSDLKRVPTDVRNLADHCMKLLGADATAQGVALSLDCAPDLPLVPLDPDRFAQALLNICLNGMEAMPDGGSLGLRIDMEGDEFVRLRIADSGHGIPAEVLGQIFDPYYTTKSQGTGLGLAIVHKIIESHGGAISAASGQAGGMMQVGNVNGQKASGTGTVFTILLPVAPLQES